MAVVFKIFNEDIENSILTSVFETLLLHYRPNKYDNLQQWMHSRLQIMSKFDLYQL